MGPPHLVMPCRRVGPLTLKEKGAEATFRSQPPSIYLRAKTSHQTEPAHEPFDDTVYRPGDGWPMEDEAPV